MEFFVGNLAYSVTTDELRAAFQQHGYVESAKVITERETGRSRGFGFVDMPHEEEALRAWRYLEGSEIAGRPIRISRARGRGQRSAGCAG